MSNRLSYFLAIFILLAAVVMRLHKIVTLPAGLSSDEITDIRVAETAREGSIEVFYDLGNEGREGLYHFAITLSTSLTGNGPLGYRMFSVWAGLLALCLTYALGKQLFGKLAGLSAMSLLAANFWHILLSRQIARETLIPLFVVYTLICLASILRVYRRRRKRGDNTSTAAALGALLGLAFYLHPLGMLTGLASVLFIGYMVIRRGKRMSRRRMSYLSFAVLLMIILSMPYFISTIRLPALAGVERLTGDGYPAISFQSVGSSLKGIFISGDENPQHNLPSLPLFDPISGVFLVFGFAYLVYDWRQPRHAMILIFIVILSPVFLLAANAPDFMNFTSVLPIFALLSGYGITLIANRIPRFGTVLGTIVILAIFVLNLSQTQQNLFEKWRDLPAAQQVYNARLGALAHYIDQTSDDIPTVVCGWRVGQRPSSLILSNVQKISLMLNRHNTPIREVDCYNALVMTNGGAYEQVIVADPSVMNEAHPQILQWLRQGTFIDDASIPPESVLRLDVENPLADRLGLFTVQSPVSYAPEVGGSRDDLISPPITFGGNLTLLGYIPESNPQYRPGSIVTLVTFWRVDGVVPADLRLFTHILADPGATPPANTDVINLNPASLKNRDVFIQVTYVPLPEALPAGEYWVSIGAYQNTSDERLDVLDAGVPRGSRLILYPITVQRENS